MTLANMRQNGVHAVTATCEACGHKADVNVDALPESLTVPRPPSAYRAVGFVTPTVADLSFASKMADGDLVRSPPFPPDIIRHAV